MFASLMKGLSEDGRVSLSSFLSLPVFLLGPDYQGSVQDGAGLENSPLEESLGSDRYALGVGNL